MRELKKAAKRRYRKWDGAPDVGSNWTENVKGAKGDPSSSRPGIDVVQASQHRSLGDGSIAYQGSGQRALEPQASMGAVQVVVIGELREHGAQMPLIDDDHVIKALLPDRAN
jgi:hypothetical protein